jgi:thiol-disulfide isomerase/thioredoxin
MLVPNLIAAALLLIGVGFAVAGSDVPTPTPLDEAVKELNRKTENGYFDREGWRQPPLAKNRRPKAVTVDEVAAAIRNWDRKKVPVTDETYQIFQRIAGSKALPPGSRLSTGDEWRRPGGKDKYEYRVWRVQLDVMTGKDTGYSFVVREERLDRRIALLPAEGYSWVEAPFRVSPGYSRLLVIAVEDDKDGALLVTVAWPHKTAFHDLRVVAFDGDGNRHLPARQPRWGGTTPDLAMFRFRLDPKQLPASRVEYIGIEGVTGEGLRAASGAALREAKAKGIEVLPLPEVGKPYEFALTTADGKVIDSRKLRGKVVLIDCWASWCVPCRREMPDVKKVYEKWHDKGLEVVGVSLDEDPKAAAAAAKKHELHWPLVLVPAGQEARDLWTRASRVESIPRLLVIDREGVLRADLTSARELETAVAGLLADEPAWKAEFRKAYGLADGELARRVAPPYPDCRAEYFKDRLREFAKRNKLDLPADVVNKDHTLGIVLGQPDQPGSRALGREIPNGLGRPQPERKEEPRPTVTTITPRPARPAARGEKRVSLLAAQLTVNDHGVQSGCRVYSAGIEVENLSGCAAAVHLDPENLKLELLDADGKVVAEGPSVRSGPAPIAHDATIPTSGYVGFSTYRGGIGLNPEWVLFAAGVQDWRLKPGTYRLRGSVTMTAEFGGTVLDPLKPEPPQVEREGGKVKLELAEQRFEVKGP